MNLLFKPTTIQKGILIFCLLLVAMVLFELKYFLSGLLGAITLYVVVRNQFLRWIEKKKWHKEFSIWLMLFLVVITFGVPIWLILEMLIPKISDLVQNPQVIIERFDPIIRFIETNEFIQRLDLTVSNEQILTIVNRVLAYVPSTLNWVAQFFANIFVALFILYFMLSSNRKMEADVKEMLPFSHKAKALFIKENLDVIRSNAYGVPILAFSQGVIAIIGFLIFNVDQAVFWGLLTGIASVIPVVGTMVVWIPVSIYQIATGDVHGGLLLALYCFIFVGGIDNILRFTLLKRMADIPPLITVFGVLLGLQLFGAMGLVFGPWLLSLPLILYKVYHIHRASPSFLSSKEELDLLTQAEEEDPLMGSIEVVEEEDPETI